MIYLFEEISAKTISKLVDFEWQSFRDMWGRSNLHLFIMGNGDVDDSKLFRYETKCLL